MRGLVVVYSLRVYHDMSCRFDGHPMAALGLQRHCLMLFRYRYGLSMVYRSMVITLDR